jgi:hypothetical protein
LVGPPPRLMMTQLLAGATIVGSPLAHDLAPEDARIEARRPLDVIGHDEMSQQDAGLRNRSASRMGVL